MTTKTSKTFTNERGNKITVGAQRASADQVRVTIEGPRSKTSNTITHKEARAVSRAINTVLPKPR